MTPPEEPTSAPGPAAADVERRWKRLLSTLNHELRTPLTSVRGALGLLASGSLGPLTGDATRMLDIAERNIVRVVSLLDAVLDYEHLASGRSVLTLAPVDMDAVVTRACESARAMAEAHGVTIRAEMSTLLAHADADRLTQALTQLLSNAIAASPRGAEVEVHTHASGSMVRVEVLDRGPGLPPEERERVFEPFHVVEAGESRQKAGIGLGLAIARVIIRAHKGEIGLDSRDDGGVGSNAWFTVPGA
ncbi:MAG: HAMP domain-containing histidine kinase [Acidobacteria bacterium]|nr:HAMP domain-containing histidine kinase [Acidobacteriota bacterium]